MRQILDGRPSAGECERGSVQRLRQTLTSDVDGMSQIG